ncbi:RIB43A-like with coiled-coils protein 2 [Toxorhynchites rutilus septentrionalis]|uniref:RIB43A-like with coiled-coils protein 2 n=1 Tax=Toxorhynchites rutilus septentrionalis TaxID=329112 RepID=UPI0024783D75|nr:RIB43A-like with coiled-coils protein 2 [Toxorhynchites rutilus septentrionalis]
MLNSLFIKHEDLKEAAAIERRRQYEEARKQRIFNARRRVIGVDTAALAHQIGEKNRIQQEEHERRRKFIDEQQRQSQAIERKCQEQTLFRHQLHNEINHFRVLHQRPEQSRDFDLFDPNGLKKSLPARVGDNDPRLSVSGAQKFDGEDLTEKERKQMQMQQQRSWLEQQIREKRRAEMDRIAGERFLEEALEARERRVLELAAEERNSRCKILEATNQFNKHLMQQQEHERQQKKREDEEDNMAEIYNHLTSDILTENPDVAKSSLGSNRIVPYSYKGMSPEEVQQIRSAQLQQQDEMRRRQQEERKNNKAWDKLANDFDRTVLVKDREINQRRRQLAECIRHENVHLSDEAQRKLNYLDRVVYQNSPTMEYFEQFNTTTR